MKYRGFYIDPTFPPIPTREFDWTATHEESDGAPDGWSETLNAPSLETLQARIDEWHDAGGLDQ